MTRRRTTTTATALAVAAVVASGCTGGGPTGAAPATEVTALGLEFPVPAGFVRTGDNTAERPRDMKGLWMGPRGEDNTSAGVSAVRLCEQPLPRWEGVLELAERGDHTGWSSYRLAGPPRRVEVEGALDALEVSGTYQLEVAATGEDATVLHRELLVRSAEDVIHRLRVEGTPSNLEEVDVDALVAAVRVTSTGCPV